MVDAFSLQDVLKEKAKAKRLWTTFIALPTQDGDQFSKFAGAMLERAAPYFGQTTTGKVFFPNGRVEVQAVDMPVETPETPAAPPASQPPAENKPPQ